MTIMIIAAAYLLIVRTVSSGKTNGRVPDIASQKQ
jgi:hypothetical protein